MHAGKPTRHFRRHAAAHQPVGSLQHCNIRAQLCGAACNFQADEAAADHCDRGSGRDPRLDRVAVLDCPQVEHAVEVGPRNRQPPDPRARRQHEFVEAYGASVSQLDAFARRVDRCRSIAGDQVDPVFRIPGGLVQPDLLQAGIGDDQFLGKRRPLIGHVRFFADQQDAALEPVLPHGLGRPPAGMAGPDDHIGPVRAHRLAILRFSRASPRQSGHQNSWASAARDSPNGGGLPTLNRPPVAINPAVCAREVHRRLAAGRRCGSLSVRRRQASERKISLLTKHNNMFISIYLC